MKTATVICNVVFGGFLCIVMLTDGPPKGTNIIWSLVPILMPVFNVMVIRVLSSPSHALKLAALAGNVVWFGLAGWRLIQELPSHPREEGLLEFVVLFTLTPLLSAVAIYAGLKSVEPAPAK